MGQRSAFQTVSSVVVAFLQQRRWTRAALAERVRVTPRTIARIIAALGDAGMPLEREGAGSELAWRVAPRWVPHAMVLTRAQVDALRRLLRRTPASPLRSALVAALEDDPKSAAVEPAPVSEGELRALDVLEDSALSLRPVRVHYHSLGRGEVTVRELSVARIFLGAPARFVAVCHATERLEWFRVAGVLDAQVLETVGYRVADRDALGLFSGSHGLAADAGLDADVCVLRVPTAHAPAVLRALPFEAEIVPSEGAIELRTRATDLRPIVRFALAWGGVVEPVTPALRSELHRAAARVLVSTGAVPASIDGLREGAPLFEKESLR